MNFFDEAALRLKQQLKVANDKDAAEIIGISDGAWKMRKQRNSFPIKEVFALATQQPELGLDPDWIVTGTTHRTEIDDTNIAYLVQCYQIMSPHDRKAMLKIAGALSDVADMPTEEVEKRLDIYKSKNHPSTETGLTINTSKMQDNA